MPDYRFSGPIAGQSLTAEPRNAPYERPPEIVDPEEALMMHLDRLNDKDAIVAMAQSVDMGLDIRTITEGILRSAVLEGLHTVDVSLLVAPVIHEFIRSNLDIIGYEYNNGFGTKEETREANGRVAQMNELSKLQTIAGSKQQERPREFMEKPIDAPPIQQEMPPQAPQQEQAFIERRPVQ